MLFRSDPEADAEEAKRLYGIEFVDMQTIKDMDAVILAVSHNQFLELNQTIIDTMYNKNNQKKVLVDIKGILNRNEYEKAGYSYWRL